MTRVLADFGSDVDDEENDGAAPSLREVVAPEFEASRLHNGQLEFLTIVRCVLDPVLQERLWPRLVEQHFASDTAAALYRRLRTLSSLGKDWPSLQALAIDPAIDSATQVQLGAIISRADFGRPLTAGSIELGNGQKVPLETAADFEGHVFDLLEAFRITRLGVERFVDTVAKVADDDEFDPLSGPELVERAASEVLAIRGNESIADALLHFGDSLTEEDGAKREAELEKLFDAGRPRFPIGIDAFDSRAGGFQPGEVVLLGSSTGGGKTAAQMTMMTNMARNGVSVAMLQLELSLQQMEERLSSHLARINSNHIRSGAISEGHQAEIRRAWSDFQAECTEAKSRFTIYAPSSATIAGCEMVFKQYPYKVWFIDYVNLLHLDGEDSKLQGWEKLSKITKSFKALAKKYGITIVIGVQVNIDKDGNIEIRYAKAMKEDADIALVWHLTQEAKEEGAVWWRHLKARQYEPFDFEVGVALEYYAFDNLTNKKLPSRTLGRKRKHVKDQVETAMEEAATEGVFLKKTEVLQPAPPPKQAALAKDLGSIVKDESLTYQVEVDDELYEEFDD